MHHFENYLKKMVTQKIEFRQTFMKLRDVKKRMWKREQEKMRTGEKERGKAVGGGVLEGCTVGRTSIQVS